jgi:hypothetical protein
MLGTKELCKQKKQLRVVHRRSDITTSDNEVIMAQWVRREENKWQNDGVRNDCIFVKGPYPLYIGWSFPVFFVN